MLQRLVANDSSYYLDSLVLCLRRCLSNAYVTVG